MARSDLLLSLVRAGTRGDRNLFQRTVDAMIVEERAKQHHVLADQLEQSTERLVKKDANPSWSTNGPIQSLLHEMIPQRSLRTIILPRIVRQACEDLIEEQSRADLLRTHNLEPRHRILLIGPPGNGKTCLAEGIAEALALPLLMVRYEGVVGSFLGETASRLNRLFEHVLSRPCVLFFDEFDTLGKERGDVHDTGEIKRVVSSLLLQIDRLPSYVVVIAATNHEELLDRAVWRRFELRLKLPPPSKTQIEEWFRLASERWDLPSAFWKSSMSARLCFESFAELEQYALDVVRRLALAQGRIEPEKIVTDRITQWKSRAGKRSR